MRKRLMKSCLLFVLLITAAIAVHGQTRTSVNGRVTDQRNANIFGAEIRLASRTGGIATTTTDGNGRFEFKNISVGDYILEVKASAFSSAAMTLTVASGQLVTKDVALSIEAVSETVVVT